ncbi:MAG: hypothetical protein IPL10_01105 [Bacteroidetes bacterium]|jgi:hypothetical protein|nr:hypothetical protein [Bacteroidota bacterium]
MKTLIITVISIFSISITSCKKDYVCVCTEKATGEKSYGDHFKAGPFVKKAAEESCKANNDVFEDGLENCHLE